MTGPRTSKIRIPRADTDCKYRRAENQARDAHWAPERKNPDFADSIWAWFWSYPQAQIRDPERETDIKINPSIDAPSIPAPAPACKAQNWEEMIEYSKVGGYIVMEDPSPAELCPAGCKDLADHELEFALANLCQIPT